MTGFATVWCLWKIGSYDFWAAYSGVKRAYWVVGSFTPTVSIVITFHTPLAPAPAPMGTFLHINYPLLFIPRRTIPLQIPGYCYLSSVEYDLFINGMITLYATIPWYLL